MQIGVASVVVPIKDNRSFCKNHLGELEKMHTDFGILDRNSKKQTEKKEFFFSVCFMLKTYMTVSFLPLICCVHKATKSHEASGYGNNAFA
ncbi:hypothetical protein AJGP001_11855 [Planococcus faecalis]|uniref:Uncharacterized protein n=1 Tax=Planococcus faecalis TaxID=1598147 RepID=A0ABN4XS76_9BACL|nr:hypothetical protein AJGP001_11855 [Planococcus faecalis]OHX53425.1 hypothetical protein BB777_09435 [Planococcus faecalis]